MWSIFRKWIPVTSVAFVIIVIMLVVRPLVETNRGPDGGKTAPTSSSSRGDSHPVPTESVSPEDASPPVTTCQQVFSPAGYDRFIATLENYEKMYIERAPSAAYKEIATPSYIGAHSFIAIPSPESVTVALDAEKTSITCVAPSGTQIIALIKPVISVYRGDGNSRRLVNGPFESAPHFTVWVKQDKKWLIDNEY